MILLADSGSTKTDWCLVDNQRIITRFNTQGINPYQQDEATICNVLANECLPELSKTFNDPQISMPSNDLSGLQCHFYGAGCLFDKIPVVKRCIEQTLHIGNVEVQSDLMAAARALCQHEEGIACILGTGSNSCLYDGIHITSNVPPLGYILGDEGSGAVLGKCLVGNLVKGQLPKELKKDFEDQFNLNTAQIIERVYRQPLANRFLANLSIFLASHRDVHAIHEMLLENFISFFRRNVALYGCPELPVHFIGGVAAQYTDELDEAAETCGFILGTVTKSPMLGMIRFHA